mmetsp:Transcript_39215/g.50666  ORF Transcript_39215/g.50666 Transcript_39215/m.50666 type:complete len:190 (+) Transcript_39215:1-570(+)
MAVNCFLFIFQGNANRGENIWEILTNQATYVVISSICLTPVMVLISLLFKKTSHKRPQLEDRWIGAPRKQIPKQILPAVKCREDVLVCERKLRKVLEEKVLGRRFVRDTMEELTQEAISERRHYLYEKDEDMLMLLKQRLEQEHKRAYLEAKGNMLLANHKYHKIQKEQKMFTKKRISELRLEATTKTF